MGDKVEVYGEIKVKIPNSVSYEKLIEVIQMAPCWCDIKQGGSQKNYCERCQTLIELGVSLSHRYTRTEVESNKVLMKAKR